MFVATAARLPPVLARIGSMSSAALRAASARPPTAASIQRLVRKPCRRALIKSISATSEPP
jgi:hypothetical protein